MNVIIKYGKHFMAISDRIEADRHRHWLLQLFLGSNKHLNIEINDQRIPCRAVLVNINTDHLFQSNGEPNFIMLVDPTTELGRKFKGLLGNAPFFVLPDHQATALQQAFQRALATENADKFLVLARHMTNMFSDGAVKAFDDRVNQVLRLFEECELEDDVHQINDFAGKIGLSESRLAHLFKEETGIPLKSYIVLHKLQKAYDAIFDGETITTAALKAGFNSSSHFAYMNKLMTGKKPTCWISITDPYRRY